MPVDTLIKLLYFSFPVIVIVTVIFFVVIKISKEKSISFDFAVDKLYGMRSPTDEEAESIRVQVAPRLRKTLVVMSLVLIPLAICPGGAAIAAYSTEGIGPSLAMGFLAITFLSLYAALISVPLSDILSLRKKRYLVSDCYFADIRPYMRYSYRGIPSRAYRAYIRDQAGTCWETDLPKDLIRATVGTSCLVIIYDSEDKVNRSRRSGKPVYRRAVYVPRDELI